MFTIVESLGVRLVDRFVPALDAAAMPGGMPADSCTPMQFPADHCPTPGCAPGFGCIILSDCNTVCVGPPMG